MQPLLLKDLHEVPAVVVGWRAPYAFGVHPDMRPFRAGMTIAEIVKEHPGLPANFMERGTVTLNGHELSREHWHLIRPKVFSQTQPHILHLSVAPRGGKKGGGGKAIIGVVALIALTIATAGIASVGIGAGALSGAGAGIMGGWFAAGTISAKILAASVGLIGALAIAALTKPPTTKPRDDSTGDGKEAAGAIGNVLEPNGSIPRVVGTRKVYPPLACEPFVELIGDDEYATAVYILNGQHQISDIKVGDSSIEDDPNIEYQVREGWPGDDPQTLATRIGRTVSTNMEIKGHTYAANSGYNLADQTHLNLSVPQWHRIATRKDPDHFAMHLLWPGGLVYTPDITGAIIAMPLRIRIRRQGDVAWINLPELHFRGLTKAVQQRAQVILHWETVENVSPVISNYLFFGGFVHAFQRVPGQSSAPADPTYQWEADSYFYSGSGDRYLTGANSGASGIRNIRVDANGARILGLSIAEGAYVSDTQLRNCVHVYLDPATYPKGIYEVEVMRGTGYSAPALTPSSYNYAGVVCNFFKYYEASGTMRTFVDSAGYSDTVVLTRALSIWDETPTPHRGFTYIVLRAKNKTMQQMSCRASGWVRDWDGSSWSNWVVTDNPAPHFVDTLIGSLNRDPIDPEDLDNDDLVEWRARNIADGRRCNAIIENMRNDEARDLIAGCGRARSYQSEVWGVIQDYDRSAELPVCTFSARNARSFSFEKAFSELPDGLLATYVDEDGDYTKAQIVIPRSGDAVALTSRVEQVSYEGLVTEAEVTERAQFDLRQGEYRSTFYYLEAPPEHIRCRRGSLVAVQHDVLERWSGAARIKSVNVVSTDIVSIVLDAEIEIKSTDGMESATDMLAVTDVLELGITMGCSIRRTDGTISVHELSNGPGFTDTLVFATPAANTMVPAGPFDSTPIPAIDEECQVTIGPLGSEYTRMLVWDIAPGADLTARMTLIDEAPELWD